MTGMIKGFFGFERLDFRIFWIGNFGKYLFGQLDLGRDFYGYSKQP